MNAWFSEDRQDRLAALRAAARRWIGTPFFPNSSSPGPRGGVSCQKLVASIYRESGFSEIDVPDVPMSHARFNRSSLVEAFMDGRQDFVRYCRNGVVPPIETARPGDLLGFRIHHTVHHLGLCTWDGVFVHAIEGLGVTESCLSDPTWGSRLGVLWRPVEP